MAKKRIKNVLENIDEIDSLSINKENTLLTDDLIINDSSITKPIIDEIKIDEIEIEPIKIDEIEKFIEKVKFVRCCLNCSNFINEVPYYNNGCPFIKFNFNNGKASHFHPYSKWNMNLDYCSKFIK